MGRLAGFQPMLISIPYNFISKMPCCCCGRWRSSLARAARLHQLCEAFGRMRDNRKAHQRVRPAAVLGALAAKGAGHVRLNAHKVAPPGNHVELAGQARHPEAVDHVS